MPTPGIHRASSSSNRGSLLYHSADSEGVGASQQPETKATQSSSLLHWHKACALIVDDGVLGGEELGLPTDIRSHLIVRHIEGNASWLGFVMEIPRGVSSEDYGFGMCYSVNPLPTGKLEPARTYKLEVKFSLFGMEHSVEPVGSALLELLHGRENQFSVLEVHLGDNSDPRVSGFGMPFANSGHPSDAWINSGQPIIGKHTLLNILSQRTFRFVVESPADNVQASFVTECMHPPFSYPYDTQHHWDLRNYKTPNKAKGHTFNRVWQFESHNDHVAVMAQSEVQDAIWLHNAAQKIINYKFRAYFVMAASDFPWEEPVDFYAIVRLTPLFLKEYASALRCLISDEVLGLNIHDNDHGKSAARWPARVVHNPMTIDALVRHGLQDADSSRDPSKDWDLVLSVRRPKESDRRPDFRVKTFQDRHTANSVLKYNNDEVNLVSLKLHVHLAEYQDKTNAMVQFHPDANPTNKGEGGVALEKKTYEAQRSVSSDIRFKMSLHRDLVLGNGFFKTLGLKDSARSGPLYLEKESQPTTQSESSRALPSVNLLQLPQRHIKALMEEVLPSDRKRLCAYLSKAPLGFGLITGGPGFGKTTVLSVATLGMSITLGPIYASAATDVATDNFAEHLNRISERFTRRLNESKRMDDSPAGRILVVRGYFEEDEIEAFQNLLEHPQMGDAAAPRSNSSYRTPWRLQLSLTFWLLVALRSPAVRPLHYEDNEEIHLLQSYLDHRGEFERLRNVAAGVISFEEYKNGRMVSPYVIKHLFQGILRHADILCTNPALSCKDLYAPWKKYVARGIAVDEAGSISRPDLYSLWGNTLLPCLLCGDDKQLAPRLMSFGQRDYLGNSVNRHEHDGKLSALLFFQGNGWPVFRLRTQLRMATGLFNICNHDVYGSPPTFDYGPNCNINLEQHECGRELEAYLRKEFPELASPPAHCLVEAFLNCRDSKCHFNAVTGSGWNPVQSKHALDFICDLVTNTKVTPGEVFIITPYRASVEYIERQRKEPEYSAISAMAPAATIEDFQGRQGNIIILVTATTAASRSSPIFDVHHLSVMLSRQISGLVIFGDLEILSEFGRQKSKAKQAQANGKYVIAARRKKSQGLKDASLFCNVLDTLMVRRRVATLPVPNKQMVLLPPTRRPRGFI